MLKRRQQWVLGIAAIISAFLVFGWMTVGGSVASPFYVGLLLFLWFTALTLCWLLRT